MEILGKLLGSPARVKIMRLFLQNKNKTFDNKEVANRSRVTSTITRREINLLASSGFIKKLSAGWIFNQLFEYGSQFEEILVNASGLEKQTIIENIKKAGKIKLLIASGVFIKDKDARADLLIVGDKIKPKKIEEGIKKLEAEIGAELAYVVFDTKEFVYRLDMHDKLVRDILDFPHETIFIGKELSTQSLKRA